jgi:FG-GAP-like repeat
MRDWLRRMACAGRVPSLPTRHRRHAAVTRKGRWSCRPFAELLEDRTLLSLSAPVNYPAGNHPLALVSADLRGKGILDIVTANYSDNTVSVLFGNGNGTFAEPPASYAAGDGPVSVTAAALSGPDKTPDLLVADASSNAISVLLNNGDGTFHSSASVQVGNAPSGIAVGDFNHDGKPDLAVANEGDDSVSVLLGNGDGTFRPWTTLHTDAAPTAIITANLNGELGLVVACGPLGLPFWQSGGGHTVDVFLGRGDGTFTGPAVYTVGSAPSGLALVDLNADGKPDLVTSNLNDGTVSVLPGNGDGTFGQATNFDAGPLPVSVLAADFTGDGVPDLAVVDADTPPRAITPIRASISFRARATAPSCRPSSSAATIISLPWPASQPTSTATAAPTWRPPTGTA